MYTVILMGGLGNQLFQYAVGRRFALKGYEVVYDRTRLIDPTGAPHHRDSAQYGLGGFDTMVPFGCGAGPSWGDFAYHPGIETLTDPHVLWGHFQCEKYFESIIPQLRKELTIIAPISDSAKEWSRKIQAAPNSAFLHVRRGDYTTIHENPQFHGLMGMEYYLEAMKVIEKRSGSSPSIFIFSDDPEWCREAFPGYNVVSGHTQFEDLWLMQQCQHAIIANSTFSWWGAWLGDDKPNRTVIGPHRWFVNKDISSKDVIPARWIKL